MFEPPRLGFEAKIRKNIVVGFSGVHACVYISWTCFPDDTGGCKQLPIIQHQENMSVQ